MAEQKERHKSARTIGVNYVWPHYEKELYSICAQRRCTLQLDGKTKNMSENFLMREQLGQNSRKRKDKRIKVEDGGSDGSENKGIENVLRVNSKKNSKQDRRVVMETKQVTPRHDIGPTSENNNDHIVGKKKLLEKSSEKESLREVPARKQLEYGEPTENHVVFNDVKNNNSAEATVEETEAGPKRRKTASDDVFPNDEIPKAADEFSAGYLIWGKLKGFDWWPGVVVDFKNASQCLTEARPNEVWVKWYGDNKFSKLPKNDLAPFRHFGTKFLPQKCRGTYKRAVVSALEVAVSRCQKQFPSDPTEGSEKPSKEQREKLVIDWALENFQPSGPEAFEIVKDECKAVISMDTVAPEVEWNQREGKQRFGQPIRTPALAEDVKAIFDQVKSGMISIDDICLGCGDTKNSVPHPLFHGSLCDECKETFLECSYLFDADGYQMYCTICGDGKEVFMCESTGCFRSYCAVCLELICGSGTVDKVSSLEKWYCAMCLDVKVGLLRKRDDWQQQLCNLFASDQEQEYPAPTFCPPILPGKRQPIRVLSLFDGIATGLQTLKELDIEVELYIASEIDENATQVVKVQHAYNDVIKFVGDIEKITREQIEQWGPFDLVIGASPCNDLSIANPARQGIYEGSGRLFFEFFRLLMYAKPLRESSRPFFWLFENVVSMRAVDKKTISRFLQCNPVVVDAKDMSPARRARYFWGNLPGMNRPTVPIPGDKLCLQTCLEPNCGRTARFTKIQTITTKGNSLKQTKEGILPVQVASSLGFTTGDVLWCTEMERLFGFPPHYTDVGNMGKNQRQKLLGKAWCVPVVRHLLSPLRDYFSSKLNDTLGERS